MKIISLSNIDFNLTVHINIVCSANYEIKYSNSSFATFDLESVYRLNSEDLFFPFRRDFTSLNCFSDPINNAQSHDMKIGIRFPGNPVLGFNHCVGELKKNEIILNL